MSTTRPLIDVVKRGGKRTSERFNPDKLHASVYAACLSVRSPEGMARTAADSVCTVVIDWCHAKPEVTSNDLRRVAAGHLERIHPEAAYLYKHHRLVL
ncbi:MAG: transcriptional repressor NrdR [Patescibacteria group bacterium]|nr:transcriptional repressor NrdR [Patescibacteria group bacterium]